MSDILAELRVLLASRHGLLVAADPDERRTVKLLEQAATESNLPLWRWDAASGLRAASTGRPQVGTESAAGALAFVREMDRPGVFLFADAQPLLDDPVAVRMAKEIGMAGAVGRTVVLTGVGMAVPEALHPVAVLWAPPPPDRAEVMALVRRTARGLAGSGMAVKLTAADAAQLVEALIGLSPIEAERLIVQHTVADGQLTADDLRPIREARAELLSKDSPLDLIDSDIALRNVGGLDSLKKWLTERGRGFEPAAREFGLPTPRGVLLTGVPGTGKSLVAKAIANTWGMALVALDTGRLHGSFVGESEKRLSRALAAATAMAPVVMWIDEVEKAFSANDSDSGASSRTLGVLLSWLQERPDGVFVIATSNDVTALPPELTRRGRFDEVFFVDLPSEPERVQILSRQLADRGRDTAEFDLAAVARATEGYSGAELGALVVGALYAAFAAGGAVTTEHLLAEAADMVPLSVLRAEDIAAMRDWARGRAVRA